jgi:hypothetical protein
VLPKLRSPTAPGLSVALVVELVAGPLAQVQRLRQVAGFGAVMASALRVESFWQLPSWRLGFDLILPL